MISKSARISDSMHLCPVSQILLNKAIVARVAVPIDLLGVITISDGDTAFYPNQSKNPKPSPITLIIGIVFGLFVLCTQLIKIRTESSVQRGLRSLYRSYNVSTTIVCRSVQLLHFLLNALLAQLIIFFLIHCLLLECENSYRLLDRVQV